MNDIQNDNSTVSKVEPKFITILTALLVPLCGFFVWYLINFFIQFVFSFGASMYVAVKNPNLTADVLQIKTMNIIYENISLMYFVITVLFLLLVYIFQKKFRFSKYVNLEYKKPSSSMVICSLLLGTFVGVVSNIGIDLMSKFLPQSWIEGNLESVQTFRGGNVFIMIIAVVVCAPMAEEIIFRGLIYNALKKIFNIIPNMPTSKTRLVSMIASAVISSALFGIYHGNILQAIYTAIFSLFMVWIYEMSGSIFTSMVVHCAFNFAGMPTYFFVEKLGKIPSVIVCTLFSIFVVIAVFQIEKRKAE